MAQRYKDEAGNIWEMGPNGQPSLVSAAQGPSLADPKLPGALQGQALQNVHTQQQIDQTPLQNQHTQAEIAQAQTQVKNTGFDNVNNLRNQFEKEPAVQDYKTILPLMDSAMRAKNNKAGDLNIVYAFGKSMDPGSVVREGEQVMATNVGGVSEKVKGYLDQIAGQGQLTPVQRTQLVEEIRSRAKAISETYNQRRSFYEDFANRNGINALDVVGPHPGAPFKSDEVAYIEAHGGHPVGPRQQELATGKSRSEYDPKVSAEMNAAIRAGIPYERAVALAAKAGYPAPDRSTYQAAVAYAKQNPDYRKSLAEATRTVPTTAFQQFAASPAGAFISGAGKAATMGFGDEIAGAVQPGDYATNRDAFAAKQGILANEHSTADFLGQLGGGFAAGAGMAGALSKVPGLASGMFGPKVLPNLLSREAVAGDALYGTGYGAGSNNENRLAGGLQGLGLGVGGGIAARGAVNGIASTISPTGGKLAPLYEMGVRPSIGQRIGGPVNSLEEKFQSIPLVGDAIKGTRDRARDQYQIGLFNDALSHLNRRLPEGMSPGHAPHAFAQDAISNAYDGALSNMSAAADSQFGQDLGALQQKIGGLRADSQGQFKKIWDGSIGRRFVAGRGQIVGDAYKQAESEIGKKVAAIRSNPTGDHELAGALEDALGALRGSALRNSPPEAVQALNAADAAHAKIVRIEEASRKAGEPAEFSPTQYNTAVKTTSGGVRNRNYLRGDALNTELAALGTKLGDKVSNSGTVDRLAAGGLAYGFGAVNPYAAGAMGGLGAVNFPGIRNVVTELMAPRANPIFDRAADQLRQRARLAGMFGAPAAIDYYGQ